MTTRKTDGRESRSDATRAALIAAALKLFGSKGFEATSTREIAAAADANIGSIAYHFGGKDGLRDACAQFIAETIKSVAVPAIGMDDVESMSPDEAEQRLVHGIGQVLQFIISSPEAGAFVQFVLRELSTAGSALDILYGGVFEPMHVRLCQLWSKATGDPAESEATRIAVFAMIGQVVYFRIGREAVLRRMDWPEIGAEQAAALTAVITKNIRTIVRAHREEQA